MKTRFAIVLATVGLVCTLTGCAGNKQDRLATDAGAANSLCPMKPGCALKAGSPTVQYKGQTVAFCCNGCVSEWAQISDAERDERLAKAK
jgi:hypothetical protein